MNEILTWLLDFVQGVDPVARTIIAGVAMMLETSVLIGLIVPGDTMVLVAATAVDSIGEGLVLGVVIVVGALLGETFGFYLGRLVGPALRRSRLGRRIGAENWRKAERYLNRRGGPAIFLSRFLPVLHSLVPLTVGMSGFRYTRFLAWTVPACILWSALYVSVGALAASTFRELSDTVSYAAYIFVGMMVLFVVFIWLGKRFILRRESRHFDVEDEPAQDAVDGQGVED